MHFTSDTTRGDISSCNSKTIVSAVLCFYLNSHTVKVMAYSEGASLLWTFSVIASFSTHKFFTVNTDRIARGILFMVMLFAFE